MDSIKKVTHQTLWQLLGKIASGLTGLLVLSLITRNYGPAGTGVFTLALTYLSFFYIVAGFGFNSHFLPLLIKEDLEIFRKLMGLRIVWALLLTVVAVLLAPLLPIKTGLFSLAVDFGAIAILGSALYETTNSLFQARLRYDSSAIPVIIGSILGCSLALYIIVSHYPVFVLPLSEGLTWLVCAVSALILLKRLSHSISPIFDLAFAKNAFLKVWPIALTLMINVVYFRVDSLLISSFRSISEAGLYNVAYALFQSALVIPTFIMNGYYPLMLGLLDQKDRFRAQLKKALLIMLGFGVAGTLLTWVLAPLVIGIIVGTGNFIGSVTSLRLLSLSFPAYFLTSVLMLLMIARKRYKAMLVVYLVGLVVNLSLNLILIPVYSFTGAAIVTDVSEYLILVIQILILSKEI